MEYFLKASAISVIFYACYAIFLQRETFFVSNRWFLIVGLVTAVLFPMLVIPIYVEVKAPSFHGITMIATTGQTIAKPFDWTLLLHWIYGIGASFFFGRLIIQLISLIVLVKKNDKKKIDHFTFVETDQNTTPFSFFRWIVYNPKQFNPTELELILKHEKVHAKQMHSLDVLLMDLATVLFWFNPLIWLYRNALKQNLEFIADRDTQKQSDSEERYQKLLLKTSLPQQNLTLINTFYNSTIKNRIVMLHQSKSHLMNSWKYTIIIPVLIIFAMTFNTKTIAQTSHQASERTVNDQQNILTFVITKDTKDTQLHYIKDKLAESGATISFNDLKRNAKNEITSIKIQFKYKNSTGNHATKSSTPINSIEISINPSDETINVGQQVSSLSQTFDVNTNESGQTTLKKTITTTNNSTNSKTISDEEDSYNVIFIKKDENKIGKDTMFVETTTDKVDWINKKDKNVKVISVKKRDSKTNLLKNDENPPLVIFDGKEINNNEMNAISPNDIESIQVLKDKTATITYGEKGKNGVILITSKNKDFFKTEHGESISILTVEDQKPDRTSISNTGKTPLYILDGKEITAEQMKAVSTNTIESIEVLKDKSATEKYGKKGKNGVIIITLKKD